MADVIHLTFDADTSSTFSVDREARTIKGLLLPYGAEGDNGRGRYIFTSGTLAWPQDLSRIKFLSGAGPHEFSEAVGYMSGLEETDQGPVGTFKIARGAEGDRALSMAEDRVWDGLSVGIGAKAKFSLKDGVFHAISAPVIEVSQTPLPAFDGARVTSVAASAAGKEPKVGDENEQDKTGEAVDFSGITDAIKAGFEGIAFPQRETVPAGGETFEVHEPTPYRFDGIKGEHSFLEDMRSATQGDSGARQRLDKFSEEFERTMFAVTTGNVSALNPTRNRPDLYVPNLTFSRPLWEMVANGAITDRTPFTVPKFSTAMGLVNTHTEGVEPTPGSFSATAQTVTPNAVSGKIEVNREVIDAGGSPQVDSMIWTEIQNAYYEAIETKIAQTLNGVATAEVGLASAVDAALVNALTNYLAGLQFVRGGNRFTAFAADDRLFPKLVSAADSTGRKLLPVLGPDNAQGTTGSGFDRVQLGNLSIRAAWALSTALGTNHRSFNFVPSSVWAWASAPKKFEFQYQVKSVDIAVWGYSAAAVLRDSDVQPIDYDVAD